ncbi:POK8 protein, partial [Eubucco bourcierii]|nr:POK8 protein [Eubucco bourcierii]
PIVPQNFSIDTQIQTLHDAQKLLGSINWLQPLLGISNHDLALLFDLLKGDTNLLAL